MGFFTKPNGKVVNTDKRGTGEIYQRDPEKIKELRDKVDFSTRQARTGADHQKKSFIDSDGDEEELEDFYYDVEEGKWKPPGYGMAYSHPRHLREKFGGKVGNFKDMDKIIDENELLRVIDEKGYGDKPTGRTISTGTTISNNQMDIIRANFEEGEEKGIPVRAKITSNSRKKYKNFEDFYKAARIQDEPEPDYDDIAKQAQEQRDFDTHIGRLSENT